MTDKLKGKKGGLKSTAIIPTVLATTKSHLICQNIVSDIFHCESRALSDNSARYHVILYATMF